MIGAWRAFRDYLANSYEGTNFVAFALKTDTLPVLINARRAVSLPMIQLAIQIAAFLFLLWIGFYALAFLFAGISYVGLTILKWSAPLVKWFLLPPDAARKPTTPPTDESKR